MAMKRLLELMAEKKASDIFISCGAPISIKINGVTMPINQQIVTPDTVRALMKEILTERQLADFEENFELNTSYPMRGLGSFRISARRFSMRCAPSERAIVTTAVIASGMAATARLTAVSSISSKELPCNIPNRNTIATITSAAIASHFPSLSRRCCRGVFSS